jgi:tripartite-type tricarboxylate transporter receptor subunit TctC
LGGLCGPAGLPPAVVEKASALLKKALESEALKTASLAQGAVLFEKGPAVAAAFRRKKEKQLAPIIKASGAAPARLSAAHSARTSFFRSAPFVL